MKILAFQIIVAFILPTAVNAEFVFPWKKVEPNYSSKVDANKACFKLIQRKIKEPFFKEILDSERRKYGETEYFTKREVLSSECRHSKTTDKNVGELTGWVSWLEWEYINGKLVKTPEVQQMIIAVKEKFYYPY